MPEDTNRAGLVVLFDRSLNLDAVQFEAALGAVDRALAQVRYVVEGSREDGAVIATVAWAHHSMDLLAYDRHHRGPMLETAVNPEMHVARTQLDDETAAQALNHQALVVLHYTGSQASMIEQYVALLLVARAMDEFGGFLVVNERALSAIPISALVALGDELASTLPNMLLPQFFCGCLRWPDPETGEIWVRTAGAVYLGLPDLAWRERDRGPDADYLDLMASILQSVHQSDPHVGETVIAMPLNGPAAPPCYLHLRERQDSDPKILKGSRMLIVEEVDEQQAESLLTRIEADIAQENSAELPLDRLQLARSLLEQEKLDECQAVMDKLKAVGESSSEFEQLAARLAMRTTLAKSSDLDTVRRESQINPEDLALRLELAGLLAATGEYTEALEIGLSVLQLDRIRFGESARQMMVQVFHALGNSSPVTREYRRKLSALLY